jgi:hypothetical protein
MRSKRPKAGGFACMKLQSFVLDKTPIEGGAAPLLSDINGFWLTAFRNDEKNSE